MARPIKRCGRKLWLGLVTFYAVCSLGLLANLSVVNWVMRTDGHFYFASIIGVLTSVVFNYAVTRVFTWR